MLQSKKIKVTDLKHRILLDEKITEVVDGVSYEVFKPFMARWAFVEFKKTDYRERNFKANLNYYNIIFKKNYAITSRLGDIGRVHWNCKILYMSHLFEPHFQPQFIFGTCFEKKCEE